VEVHLVSDEAVIDNGFHCWGVVGFIEEGVNVGRFAGGMLWNVSFLVKGLERPRKIRIEDKIQDIY
jgi:hypothetical protein